MSTTPPPVDYRDIQGLVRFGYRRMTQASFLLLRIKDADAARDWLGRAPVSSAAAMQPAPTRAMQVALSCEGLRALGVTDDIIGGFSAEFIAGMSSDASRARRLGDAGASEPACWQWGGSPQQIPHVMVMLYANRGGLDAWKASTLAEFDAAFELMTCLDTTDMDGIEPFGFADGISEPGLDWQRQRPVRDEEQLAYGNLSCLGEFLLGYPNEYGGYTDRPLLDAARDPDATLARAEEAPDKADLGRNGSYLVLRQLRQDVRDFWRFADRQADGDPVRRRQLAEAMVGRTLAGEPLVGRTGDSIVGEDDPRNSFTYGQDPQGLRCPIGAHIRRSNPRNADLPPGGSGPIGWFRRQLGFDAEALAEDRVSSARFHRILRRGRAYGAPMSLHEALSGPGASAGNGAGNGAGIGAGIGTGKGTGLHFICLGANIARQFEFVQSAWLAGIRFAGLSNESDPLLGNHLPRADGIATDGFSMAVASGPDRRVSGLPHFVTVEGGAYFFLPSLSALQFLSKGRP